MLTPQDLQGIRGVVREEVRDQIQSAVPGMIHNEIQKSVPGMIRVGIQENVPGMIHNEIQKSVPGMIQDVISREISASESRLIKRMKVLVHSEHVKTRATINEVVDYFDKRVRVTEHRLDRVERTLDLPKLSN